MRGVVRASVLASRASRRGRDVAPRTLPVGGSHIRVDGVRLPGVLGNVIPQGLRLSRPLLGFLAQPGSFHLGLLGVGPGTRGPGLVFAGIQFNILGLAADLGRLFAVRLIPLLLDCLTALPRHQKQHNQHHHNDCNYHPNPWFHATHLFLCCYAGPADAHQKLAFRNMHKVIYQGYLLSVGNHAYYFTASIAGS